MRNRTEQVTNTFEEGSDEEELADSGDDWQPEEDEKPKGKGKRAAATPKAKNGAKGGARGAKKRKKDDSEEEESEEEIDEDESEEEEKPAKKKGGRPPKKTYDTEEDTGEDSGAPTQKKGSSAKNFPDKQGFLSLYIFKGDLVNGIKANENLCLWRRDGSSLLQKYLRDKNSTEVQWSPSMVYSCWEDRRKDEYLEVKVLCKGDLKNSNVTIVNLEELEQQCVINREEYSKYISQKDQQAAANQQNTSTANTSAYNSTANTSQELEGDDGEEDFLQRQNFA